MQPNLELTSGETDQSGREQLYDMLQTNQIAHYKDNLDRTVKRLNLPGPGSAVTQDPTTKYCWCAQTLRGTPLPACTTHIYTLVSSYCHAAKNIPSDAVLNNPSFHHRKCHINLWSETPPRAIYERLWFGMATMVTPSIISASKINHR